MLQGAISLHCLANWTLPLIQKGQDAEKVEKEKDQVATLKADHDKALKAKDESMKASIDSTVKAALAKAKDQIIVDYKVSDEFMDFGFDYLERGIKAAGRWAALKHAETGSLSPDYFVDHGFGDPRL